MLFRSWTAIITMLIMLSIRVVDPSFVQSIRLRYFDQLITSKETTVSQQVHVVNIDDRTIQQKGQFPFPRNEYSKLITDLYSHGAGLVVFNIYMPERDRFGGDSSLAQTLKQYPVVLPHTSIQQSFTTDSQVPFRPGVSIIGGNSAGVKYGNIQPNTKVINETAAGIGIVNTFPEIDGVTRRVPMLIESKGLVYPSISLETLRVAAGDPSFQVKVNDGAVEAVRVPKFGKIPTDQMGRIWVDWSTKPIEHSAVSLPKDFGGSIVIVGLTAKGLNNPVATSIGAVYPHHLQAAVLDTVINGKNITRPDYADGLEVITLIAVGVLLLFLTRWTYVGIISGVVIVGGILPISQYLYSSNLWLTDSTMLIGGLVVVMLHAYGVKFISEFLQIGRAHV